MFEDMSTTDPIRVAHLHSSLGVYGAEQWTLTVLKYHDKGRVDAVLVTIGAKQGAGDLAAVGASRGLKVHHLGGRGKLNLRQILTLRSFLVNNRVEIVHTHGFKSDVVAYLATRATGVRLVSTTHGSAADEGFRIRLYEAIGELFLRRFDRVYTVSAPQARRLENRWGFDRRRIRLLLNAVDTAMFDEVFETRRPRDPREPLQVLFAGRLCRPKGILDLIRAFSQVRIKAGAFLRLAGEGPARQEAESLANGLGLGGRIQFTGPVQDIRPLLEKSHVLVLPSYSEGIPRVVMESCAAGVPVIGSDIPGIRALIRDGQTGRIVPVGDAKTLARALEETAHDAGNAHRMALEARCFVRSVHSADRMRRELENDYQQLVHGAAIAVMADTGRLAGRSGVAATSAHLE